MNYLIEQKLTLAKPRFSVRDENENEVYLVEGKALRVHEQLWIRDVTGRDVAFVRGRGAFKTKYEISKHGALVATMEPKQRWLKLNFLLTDAGSGAETVALGNFTGYEYAFERNGAAVASVKKTRRWTDRYTLEVADGEDAVVYIASVLAIDAYHEQLERRKD